jgi:GntR family transcriptional regulator of vanillate catabolism
MARAEKHNQTQRATYELRQRITNGELAGGMRLHEIAMSEALQISRTPLREAMARLTEEGLLDRVESGGFVVRSFSMRDAVDAIELRGILEGTAARMAAENGVKKESIKEINCTLEKLDMCFGANDGQADFDRYSELNALFHQQLAAMCDSAVITRELERVKSLPFASPSAFVFGTAVHTASHHSFIIAQQQHKAIISAVLNREGGRAEMIVREHARIAQQNLIDFGSEQAQAMPGMRLIVR